MTEPTGAVPPILETVGLQRFFGGLAAVRDVSLAFESGAIHAIIGPNGAGKTTLINMLSGDMRPSGGTIRFKGEVISGLPSWRISQRGIGRSYQRTNIFPAFTCWRNCWLAAQSRMTSSMRFLRPAGRYGDVAARAEQALEMAGLAHRRDATAASISHGEQRQLEIAMMLATEPEVLLLDEPMAGMGAEESERVVELVRRLAGEHTIILIEHDMDAVFALAERLTVMDNGGVLETGTPEAIRRSARVREAYLGEETLEELP